MYFSDGIAEPTEFSCLSRRNVPFFFLEEFCRMSLGIIYLLRKGSFVNSLQALEWKEKAEKHELELQQCYKAQSRLSEQLVTEIEEGKASKALLKEKEATVTSLQAELEKTGY